MNTPLTCDAETPYADLFDALQIQLDLLDDERKRALQAAVISGIFIAAITAVVLLMAWSSLSLRFPKLLMLIIIGGVAVYAVVYTEIKTAYREKFKSWILPELVQACTPPDSEQELIYSGLDGIVESEFRGSNLFREPDRYKSEDLITGTIGSTAIRFSEVNAEYKTHSSKSGPRYHTIFHGLFFVADFNKHFLGSTLVVPDTTELLLGRFGRRLQQLGAQLSFNSRELVQLEDPEFEQLFAVYSTDQVEARYILSPSLMRRLVDFSSRNDAEISLSFVAGQMILTVPLTAGKGWLEPPSLLTPATTQTLETCLEQLHLALGIVEDLNLNTRIWSK